MKEEIQEEKINIETKDLPYCIEAILFASGRFVSIEYLKTILDIDKRKIKNAIEKLKKIYEENKTSLSIFESNEAWKINVTEKYSFIINKILSDTELNKKMLETLSLIAFKSPVMQSEIINIRGNRAYDHVTALTKMKFITKEEMGRSYVLKITPKFFDYFDVEGEDDIKEMLRKVKMNHIKKMAEAKVEKQLKLGDLEIIKTSGNTEPSEIKDVDNNKLGDLDIVEDEEKEQNKMITEKPEHDLDFLDDIDKKISSISEKHSEITLDEHKHTENIFDDNNNNIETEENTEKNLETNNTLNEEINSDNEDSSKKENNEEKSLFD
jgi:segregation and condensation protein B